jgi:hypothetical protein
MLFFKVSTKNYTPPHPRAMDEIKLWEIKILTTKQESLIREEAKQAEIEVSVQAHCTKQKFVHEIKLFCI